MTMVDALMRLGKPFLGDLQSLYTNQPQIGLDGKSYAIDASTRISVEEGLFLHDSCRNAAMTATLEIGMGYGFSTTFLLAALDANSGGQSSLAHRPAAGLAHVQPLADNGLTILPQPQVPAGGLPLSPGAVGGDHDAVHRHGFIDGCGPLLFSGHQCRWD